MQSNVFNARKCKTNKYVYLDINGVKKNSLFYCTIIAIIAIAEESLAVLGRKLP